MVKEQQRTTRVVTSEQLFLLVEIMTEFVSSVLPLNEMLGKITEFGSSFLPLVESMTRRVSVFSLLVEKKKFA